MPRDYDEIVTDLMDMAAKITAGYANRLDVTVDMIGTYYPSVLDILIKEYNSLIEKTPSPPEGKRPPLPLLARKP